MQLHSIRAAGFSAIIDACARDGEQLWFLSLIGNQQSIRALWARLVKGETAYLGDDDLSGGSPCWLAREAWGTWRFHGILAPDLAAFTCERRDFLLLARSEDGVPALHYRFLNRRVEADEVDGAVGDVVAEDVEVVAAVDDVGVHCGYDTRFAHVFASGRMEVRLRA